MKILYSSCIKNPSRTNFEGKDRDEEVILTLRQHHVRMIPWVLTSILLFNFPTFAHWFLTYTELALLPLFPSSYTFVLTWFWYLISFSYVFISYMIWFFSVYLVSTKRVIDIDFSGFFNRRFSEALLSNIEDLTHSIAGLSQVLFHYGTLTMQTAGEMRELDFDYIPDPGRIQDIISDLAAASGGMRGRRHRDDD